MSTHTVEVTKIDEVMEHPNADRLSIVRVKGWTVVTGKNEFRNGDVAVYIPIDSLLPPEIEAKLFPPDSKVRLHNSRVRTIKLRGAISQGMVVKPAVLGLNGEAPGTDVAAKLGITKYEPQESSKTVGTRGGRQARKYQVNPHFLKYTDIENIKNYPSLFEEGEPVVITEKIHGTNFRAGWVKTVPNTLWKKLKNMLGLLPKYEFVYGSRNVQLQDTLIYGGYYDENVYAKIVKQYDLKRRLGFGEVVYGEVYGDGIQKNYTYGCGKGEHKLAVFDVQLDGYWMPHEFTARTCEFYGLPQVPVLYTGPFTYPIARELAKGPSVLAPAQKVREGVVVRPVAERTTYMGRKILKMINDDYLLDESNTDFH